MKLFQRTLGPKVRVVLSGRAKVGDKSIMRPVLALLFLLVRREAKGSRGDLWPGRQGRDKASILSHIMGFL